MRVGYVKTLEERFWKKVTVGAGCWTWTAHRDRDGYGQMNLDSTGKKVSAHRAAWQIANGPVPDGMFVCHSCDNPSCVRPSHLFLGLPVDNTRDMIAKGRRHRQEVQPPSLCEQCGSPFPARKQGKKGNQRFCGKSCARKGDWAGRKVVCGYGT